MRGADIGDAKLTPQASAHARLLRKRRRPSRFRRAVSDRREAAGRNGGEARTETAGQKSLHAVAATDRPEASGNVLLRILL
eukprot:925035-Prymnesium_polylepis.1